MPRYSASLRPIFGIAAAVMLVTVLVQVSDTARVSADHSGTYGGDSDAQCAAKGYTASNGYAGSSGSAGITKTCDCKIDITKRLNLPQNVGNLLVNLFGECDCNECALPSIAQYDEQTADWTIEDWDNESVVHCCINEQVKEWAPILQLAEDIENGISNDTKKLVKDSFAFYVKWHVTSNKCPADAKGVPTVTPYNTTDSNDDGIPDERGANCAVEPTADRQLNDWEVLYVDDIVQVWYDHPMGNTGNAQGRTYYRPDRNGNAGPGIDAEYQTTKFKKLYCPWIHCSECSDDCKSFEAQQSSSAQSSGSSEPGSSESSQSSSSASEETGACCIPKNICTAKTATYNREWTRTECEGHAQGAVFFPGEDGYNDCINTSEPCPITYASAPSNSDGSSSSVSSYPSSPSSASSASAYSTKSKPPTYPSSPGYPGSESSSSTSVSSTSTSTSSLSSSYSSVREGYCCGPQDPNDCYDIHTESSCTGKFFEIYEWLQCIDDMALGLCDPGSSSAKSQSSTSTSISYSSTSTSYSSTSTSHSSTSTSYSSTSTSHSSTSTSYSSTSTSHSSTSTSHSSTSTSYSSTSTSYSSTSTSHSSTSTSYSSTSISYSSTSTSYSSQSYSSSSIDIARVSLYFGMRMNVKAGAGRLVYCCFPPQNIAGSCKHLIRPDLCGGAVGGKAYELQNQCYQECWCGNGEVEAERGEVCDNGHWQNTDENGNDSDKFEPQAEDVSCVKIGGGVCANPPNIPSKLADMNEPEDLDAQIPWGQEWEDQLLKSPGCTDECLFPECAKAKEAYDKVQDPNKAVNHHGRNLRMCCAEYIKNGKAQSDMDVTQAITYQGDSITVGVFEWVDGPKPARGGQEGVMKIYEEVILRGANGLPLVTQGSDGTPIMTVRVVDENGAEVDPDALGLRRRQKQDFGQCQHFMYGRNITGAYDPDDEGTIGFVLPGGISQEWAP